MTSEQREIARLRLELSRDLLAFQLVASAPDAHQEVEGAAKHRILEIEAALQDVPDSRELCGND